MIMTARMFRRSPGLSLHLVHHVAVHQAWTICLHTRTRGWWPPFRTLCTARSFETLFGVTCHVGAGLEREPVTHTDHRHRMMRQVLGLMVWVPGNQHCQICAAAYAFRPVLTSQGCSRSRHPHTKVAVRGVPTSCFPITSSAQVFGLPSRLVPTYFRSTELPALVQCVI